MTRHQPCSFKHLKLTTPLILLLIMFPILASSNCSTCEDRDHQNSTNSQEAFKYKLISIGSIFLAGGLGVCLPFLGRNISHLHPDGAAFSLLKSFAAGVILATGFIHILPDAFETLTSPCLGENHPFGEFPSAGFVAMVCAILTLMMESWATGYHKRSELRKAQPVLSADDEDIVIDHHHHNHDEHDGSASRGHIHGAAFALAMRTNSSQLVRHRIVSQALELGIVVHSVIIGLSLGVSRSPKTIKPLVAALSFHQFFEGMGLGGCISQAKFKARAIVGMILFFSLTTPAGVAIGISIYNSYKEASPTTLIVQGILNSASAGILIYMALVDLLAADFVMNSSKMLSNLRLQTGALFTLLLGAGAMSLLAKWGDQH